MASSQFILNTKSGGEDHVLALPSGVKPISVNCQSGNCSTIRFSNGTTCSSQCMHCQDRPCLRYQKQEFDFVRSLPGFSPERDLRVCATDAISWDDETNQPRIDAGKCVHCGCCAIRCPTRAIYFNKGHFSVSSQSCVSQSVFHVVSKNKIGHGYVPAENAFTNASYSGFIVAETDELINDAYCKLLTLVKHDTRIPNLLTRNLLMTLGIQAASSRCGDVYSRTDILFTMPGKFGICEVEFNDTMIDTPRDIIEDIAIYISRYGIDKSKILPLVIGLQYPNNRSEFWEVLSDIQKVLGISTRSLSVGALMLMVWNQVTFKNKSVESIPIIDNLNKEVRNAVSTLIGRKVRLGHGVTYNVLEPLK